MAQVTSFVSDRGRAIGVVAALTASVALASAPAAFGAVDGDPIASSTFNVNFSSGQLKQNGVKLKPKKLKLVAGDVDPTTGAADLRLGKVTFKKGNKKVVYNNLKGSLPGTLKGSSGKLFKLSGGTAARVDFGASITGVKVKFLKSATKKLNRKLGLHSLHPGIAGTLSLSYQPETLKVTGGTAFIDIPISFLPPSAIPGTGTDPNTVAARQPSHCIGPAGGVAALKPGEIATLTSPNPAVGPLPTGVAARIKLPATGGTVGPDGNHGVIQLGGGVRLMTGTSAIDNGVFGPFPPACAGEVQGPTTSHSYLDTTNLAPNLELSNVQTNAFLGGTSPGCNTTVPVPGCAIFSGDRGIAIGQVLDKSAMTVTADANAKTVSIGGVLIRNNATSTTVLGGLGCAAPAGQPKGLFANATSPCDSTKDFADGDKFGFSSLTVNTR